MRQRVVTVATPPDKGPVDEPGIPVSTRVKRLRWALRDEDAAKRGRPLSHDKFAELLGTKRGTVIRWERGTSPDGYADRLGELAGLPAKMFMRSVSPKATLDSRLEAIADIAEAVGRIEALATQLDTRLKKLEEKVADPDEAQVAAALFDLQREVARLMEGLVGPRSHEAGRRTAESQ